MTTEQVADKLVQMCRDGKVEEAKIEFFTEETMSIEPGPGLLPVVTKGLKAIQQKAEMFISMVDDFYSSTISEPVIAGDYFSVGWVSDLKMKENERKQNTEICLFKVKEGKIISEQFFY